MGWYFSRQILNEHLRIAENSREWIVDLVGYHGGKLAEGCEPCCTYKLSLHRLKLFKAALQIVDKMCILQRDRGLICQCPRKTKLSTREYTRRVEIKKLHNAHGARSKYQRKHQH